MNSNPATLRTPAAASAKHVALDLADRLELGSRLRRLRESTGFTTLEVAEQVLGYKGSHAAVSRLERGVFGVVNVEHLNALAAFYGTSREALLAGTEGSDTAPPPVVETHSWGAKDVADGVAERVRDLRQAAGLARPEFAQALGWQASAGSHIKLWETGQCKPRAEKLLKMAEVFGVSGTWLILGVRARTRSATQPLRVRALRLLKGKSRPALALEAAPEEFADMRAAISCCENRGHPISRERLEKLAKAFDVPVAFLDPQGVSEASAPQPSTEAEVLYAAEQMLPVAVRKLLEQIRTTAALGLLDSEDAAAILKDLSRRVWRRPALAKAA